MSEQEKWTANDVAKIYAFADGNKSSQQVAAMTRTFVSGWQAIADAHNATLQQLRSVLEAERLHNESTIQELESRAAHASEPWDLLKEAMATLNPATSLYKDIQHALREHETD